MLLLEIYTIRDAINTTIVAETIETITRAFSVVANEKILGSMTQDELRERAHRLIPAGAHTYSKADDQFPVNTPAVIVRGKGATCLLYTSPSPRD